VLATRTRRLGEWGRIKCLSKDRKRLPKVLIVSLNAKQQKQQILKVDITSVRSIDDIRQTIVFFFVWPVNFCC